MWREKCQILGGWWRGRPKFFTPPRLILLCLFTSLHFYSLHFYSIVLCNTHIHPHTYTHKWQGICVLVWLIYRKDFHLRMNISSITRMVWICYVDWMIVVMCMIVSGVMYYTCFYSFTLFLSSILSLPLLFSPSHPFFFGAWRCVVVECVLDCLNLKWWTGLSARDGLSAAKQPHAPHFTIPLKRHTMLCASIPPSQAAASELRGGSWS